MKRSPEAAGPSAPPDATSAAEPPIDLLTPFERWTFRLMHHLQRDVKPVGDLWLRHVTQRWMDLGSSRMMIPVGLERLAKVTPQDRILLVANHRTFADLYMLLLLLRRFTPLQQRVLCPVRADFFYENLAGVAVNLLVGGGRMFPPFFREPSKLPFNRWSLQRISSVLRDEGPVIVGFHPEGKRNREPSPYTPLPAQPGAGKIVMDSWPVIVPAFINGLTNNIAADIVGNFRGTRTVVAVFGEPINLAPFQKLGDRLTSHKRIADAMLKTIYALGEEERAFRATLPARP